MMDRGNNSASSSSSKSRTPNSSSLSTTTNLGLDIARLKQYRDYANKNIATTKRGTKELTVQQLGRIGSSSGLERFFGDENASLVLRYLASLANLLESILFVGCSCRRTLVA